MSGKHTSIGIGSVLNNEISVVLWIQLKHMYISSVISLAKNQFYTYMESASMLSLHGQNIVDQIYSKESFFFQIWIRGYFDSGTFIWHPLFTEQFHSLIVRNFCTCTTQKCTVQAATKYECNTVPKLVFFFFIMMMMMMMMIMMIMIMIIIIIISWSWSWSSWSWSWSWSSSSIWQLEHHWNC